MPPVSSLFSLSFRRFAAAAMAVALAVGVQPEASANGNEDKPWDRDCPLLCPDGGGSPGPVGGGGVDDTGRPNRDLSDYAKPLEAQSIGDAWVDELSFPGTVNTTVSAAAAAIGGLLELLEARKRKDRGPPGEAHVPEYEPKVIEVSADAEDAEADPIAPSSGEFVFGNQRDIMLPWYRTPFVHARTYRSGLRERTQMGWKWVHSNDLRVVVPDEPGCEGELHVTTGRASTLVFRSTPLSVVGFQVPDWLTSLAGGFRVLRAKTGPGLYMYQWFEEGLPRSVLQNATTGITIGFDENGLIERRTDRFGYGLEYDWSKVDGEHRLDRVHFVTGDGSRHHSVDYVYYPSGLLKQVGIAGDSDYAVTYEYDEHEDLIRVTSPTGAVEEYGYRRAGTAAVEAPREFQLRSACEVACTAGEGGVCGDTGGGCEEHVAAWVETCNSTCDADCGCADACRGSCESSCGAQCAEPCDGLCEDMRDDGVFERQCEYSWNNGVEDEETGTSLLSYDEFCRYCDDHCEDKDALRLYCSDLCLFDEDCYSRCFDHCGEFPLIDTGPYGRGDYACQGPRVSCKDVCRSAYLNGKTYLPERPREFNDAEPPECAWVDVDSCEDTLFAECEIKTGSYGDCRTDCRDDCVERLERRVVIDPDNPLPQGEPEYVTERVGCAPTCESQCQAECNPTECRLMCDPVEALAACQGTCVDQCMEDNRVGTQPVYGRGDDLDHLLVEVRAGPRVGGRPPILLEHEYGTDPATASFGRVVRQEWGSETVRFSYWDLSREEDLENQGEQFDRAHPDAPLVLRRSEFRALEICPRCSGGSGCTEGFAHTATETDRRGRLPVTATVVHDENGDRRTHYYDARGGLLRTVHHDLDGQVASYAYNEQGQVTGFMNPNGARTCVAYNENGLPTTTVAFSAFDPSDWDRYDDHGPVVNKRIYTSGFPQRLAAQLDPRERSRELVRLTYDDEQNLRTIRNGAGDTTTFIPAAGHGLPETIRDADGSVRTMEYHITGQPNVVTLGSGAGQLVAEVGYDDLGRRERVVSSLGAETLLHWNGPLLDHTVSIAGHVVTRVDYEYTDGLVTRQVSCGGSSECADTIAPDKVVVETGYDEYLRPAWTRRSAPNDNGVEDAVSCVLRRPDGQIRALIDPTGARTDREFDAVGRLERVLAVGEAHAKLPTWDHPCKDLAAGPSGVLATYEYDATGLIAANVIQGSARVRTSYVRDGFGRPAVTQVDDAFIEQVFDELGNAVAVTTTADGKTYAASSYEFDEAGRLWRMNEWQADEPGTPNSSEWVAVATADYSRVNDGILRTTDARGERRTLTLDDAGRTVRVDHPSGDYEITRYLDRGRTIERRWTSPTESGEQNEVTRLTAWGAIANRSTPDGGGVTWQNVDYDGLGRAARVTGVSGQTTDYSYDGLGRLTGEIRALSDDSKERVRYGYDVLDRVDSHRSRAQRRAPWATTRYEFDSLGRTTRIDRPGGLFESQVFDPDNLSAQPNRFERNGHYVAYELGDELEVLHAFARRDSAYSGGDTERTSFEYDPLGRVIEATRNSVRTELGYDTRGNVVREWHSLMGPDPIELHYGPRGQQDTVRVGDLAGYRTFDGLGRVTRAWAVLGTSSQLIEPTSPPAATVTFAYEGLGGPVDAFHGAGPQGSSLATTFDYDALGRLDALSVERTGWQAGVSVATWNYGVIGENGVLGPIPADGAPRQVEHTVNGAWASSSTFDVDRAGRVVAEGHDGPGVAPRRPTHNVIPRDDPEPRPPWETCGIWGCDGGGSGGGISLGFAAPAGFAAPLGGTVASAATSAVGDDYDERIYELDGRANWLERQASHANLLSVVPDITAGDRYEGFGDVSVSHEIGGAVASLTNYSINGSDDHERYSYGAFGQLERARTGEIDRHYTYDAFGRRIAEQDGENGPTTVYGYAGADRVLRIEGGTLDLTVDGTGLDDHLFTVFDDGRVHYYHRDRRNSVYLVTDESGAELERYHYTAYGESVIFAPDGTVLDDTAIGNRFGFQGHVFDAELGLVDMRARFYRPAWGRFLAPDPIGLAGGPNLYGFVQGKTLTHWDPFGFDDCDMLCRAGNWFGDAVTAVADFARNEIVPRLGGALQAGIGIAGTAIGVGLCTTGIGCAIGIPLAAAAIDFGAAGGATVFTAEYTPTFTKRAATAVGGERFGRDVEEIQAFVVTAGTMVPPGTRVPTGTPRTVSTPRTTTSVRQTAAPRQTNAQRHSMVPQPQQARHSPGGETGGRPALPPYDGTTTHGVLVTNEGARVTLQSGQPNPAFRNYISAGHVEGKAAVHIRTTGSTGGTVFHNNTGGTCGYCNSHINTLLPEGVKMRVVPPADAVAAKRGAVAIPKTYTGNSSTPKPPR